MLRWSLDDSYHLSLLPIILENPLHPLTLTLGEALSFNDERDFRCTQLVSFHREQAFQEEQ